MATIYLSYKNEEVGFAEAFAREFETLGHRVVYYAATVAAGGDWRQDLLREHCAADATVVLLTERALASHFVLSEIGEARALTHEASHKLLLPVVIGDLRIPPVIGDLHAVKMPLGEEGIPQAAAEVVKALADRRRRRPRIFISHRHSDVAVAGALVKVLEAAFQVEASDLRCTSVPPYKLRAGERTGDRLRSELQSAEAVLGILTPDIKASSYVLFELGAAWGRGSVTFPLLARGALPGDVPAPIGDLHTLSLSSSEECHQLVEDLADVVSLRRQERGGGAVSQRVTELVAAARL